MPTCYVVGTLTDSYQFLSDASTKRQTGFAFYKQFDNQSLFYSATVLQVYWLKQVNDLHFYMKKHNVVFGSLKDCMSFWQHNSLAHS